MARLQAEEAILTELVWISARRGDRSADGGLGDADAARDARGGSNPDRLLDRLVHMMFARSNMQRIVASFQWRDSSALTTLSWPNYAGTDAVARRPPAAALTVPAACPARARRARVDRGPSFPGSG